MAALDPRGEWPRPAEGADPLTVGAPLLDVLGMRQQAGVVGIVLDDAHWADAASLQALVFVLRRLQPDRVLVGLGGREIGAAEEVRLELTDLPPSAAGSYFLGHLALWRARADEADRELRQAWSLLEDPEEAPGLGVGIASQLAILIMLAYRFDEAIEWGDRCLALSASAPALRGGALAVWALGGARWPGQRGGPPPGPAGRP